MITHKVAIDTQSCKLPAVSGETKLTPSIALNSKSKLTLERGTIAGSSSLSRPKILRFLPKWNRESDRSAVDYSSYMCLNATAKCGVACVRVNMKQGLQRPSISVSGSRSSRYTWRTCLGHNQAISHYYIKTQRSVYSPTTTRTCRRL